MAEKVLIDVKDLTLNAEEAVDVSEIVFELVFGDMSLLERVHYIVTGIKWKKQIVFAGGIGDSLKKASGCTPAIAEGIKASQKFWDPVVLDARWLHCQDDVDPLFKMMKDFDKINPDFYDRSASQELKLIAAKIAEALPTDILTKVWFGDTEAEHISDGGVFTDGTDLDLYNVFDGIWKQIFADIPVGSPNHVVIPQNSGTTYALQTLTGPEAYSVLNQMWLKADLRLRGIKEAKFYVTQGIYDGYLLWLEENQTNNGGFTYTTEEGQPVLRFRGFEMIPMDIWTRKIDELQNDGTKWNLPNRGLFTVKENIPIGTVSTKDFDHVESIYDPVGKQNILDVALSLDAKFLQSYLAVVAY